MGAILRRINTAFTLSKTAEISFEANPDSFLAPGYAHELKATGVNRLSLGIQSLDPEKLKTLGLRPRPRKGAALP